MMRAFNVTDLTWSFLRAIVAWAILVAGAIAVTSCVVACDPRFTVTFLIAAAFDVATLAWILRLARTFLEGETDTSLHLFSLLSTRLLAKGLLLGAAAMFPDYLDFLAMVLGVLLVDTTIMIVGSVAAALNMPSYRHSESSRRG